MCDEKCPKLNILIKLFYVMRVEDQFKMHIYQENILIISVSL